MHATTQLTVPTTESELARRLAEADNQVHSQRMEGVEFTPAMVERQRRFARGELDMDDLLKEAVEEAREG